MAARRVPLTAAKRRRKSAVAKLKTKRVAMDTLCTLTDRGWEFETTACGKKRTWIYKEGLGPNLFQVVNGEVKDTFMFIKNLDGAAYFCWGWSGGYDQGAKDVLLPAKPKAAS